MQFVLTDKSGTKYTLDRHAGLLAIVDRNGNRVDIGSDGIVGSAGSAAAASGIASSGTLRRPERAGVVRHLDDVHP